jgi:hypothetical protein
MNLSNYTNVMSAINSKIAAIQDQINSLVIPTAYTSDINSINDSIASFRRSD